MKWNAIYGRRSPSSESSSFTASRRHLGTDGWITTTFRRSRLRFYHSQFITWHCYDLIFTVGRRRDYSDFDEAHSLRRHLPRRYEIMLWHDYIESLVWAQHLQRRFWFACRVNFVRVNKSFTVGQCTLLQCCRWPWCACWLCWSPQRNFLNAAEQSACGLSHFGYCLSEMRHCFRALAIELSAS